MRREFEVIYIRKGLEEKPEVQEAIEACPQAAVRTFTRTSEVAVQGDSMGEKIKAGKSTLVISFRSRSMIDRFVNNDPGAVCPAFYKLVPSTNCVYDCEYCFLQSTYRAVRPYVCAYVIDFEELGKTLRRRFRRDSDPVLLNAGEMSDPIACDELGNMPWLVTLFSDIENVRLLLLTKSGLPEIEPLLGAPHAGNTVLAWSINCPEMIAQYEHGTASLEDRLEAAHAAQEGGYEVRFRLDPMIEFSGWQDAYGQVVAAIYTRGIRPARITLGSLRMLLPLKHIIAERFPDSALLSQTFEKNGKRLRYEQDVRERLYRHAIESIRKYDSNIPIALCKESPELHRIFEGQVDRRRCNCQI